MLKNKLKKYDDPRDTHGFYENFNQSEEVSLAEIFDIILGVLVSVSVVAVFFFAFFY